MRKETLLFAAIIFSTALTASPSIPTVVAYVLVVVAYGTLFFSLVSDRLPVFYYRPVLYPVAAIAVMFVITFIANFDRSSVLRLLSFALLTGVNILVLPALIDRRTAFKALSRVTALFVVIALPATLFGAYTVGMVTVGTFGRLDHFGPLAYYIPRSIFMSPNFLAALGILGAIAAGAEWDRERTNRAAALVVVNAAAVFITVSRSGLLVLGAAVGLYLAYRLFDVRGLAVASIGGLAALVLLILTILDALYIPVVSSISPTGRDVLWNATIHAVLQRPFVGWGLGNDAEIINQWVSIPRYHDKGTHNSYLRLFLDGGIIAGVSYIVLSITSLISSLREVYARSRPLGDMPVEEVFIVILLVGFFIYQAFGDPTIYGISPISTIGAITVGYTQPHFAIRTMK
ncbi:MAG TPA: O-antigen ligase family protein, partial [Halococcus sp.]|nr:O-antigen ligase family protein [Halococcus sp.]